MMPDQTGDRFDYCTLESQGVVMSVKQEKTSIVSVDLLNVLAPILGLPPDCTGITLKIDIDKGPPVLETRRLVLDCPSPDRDGCDKSNANLSE